MDDDEQQVDFVEIGSSEYEISCPQGFSEFA